MIPLRDENPTRTVPYVMYFLVAINILLFIYNGTLNPRGGNPLSGFELVPRTLTGGMPGEIAPISPWLTIFTSMFLHANILHLAGNMLYLWIFGNNVEDVLGHFKFLLFYLLAGVVAAFAQIITNYNSPIPMVGASGAIAGVLGGYILLFPRARVMTLVFLLFFIQIVALPASIVLGLWFVIQILSSLHMSAGGGVAYPAHVGGFLAGIAIMSLLGGRKLLRGRSPSRYDRMRNRYY